MEINNVDTLFDETLKESSLTAKQQSVLKVSLDLFAEQGFDGTSTSEIATQAGVSEGTVFKQFKTKQGILAALLEPFIDKVVPQAADEFITEMGAQQYQTLGDFFYYIVHDRMVFAINNQKQLKIFAQEIMRNPDRVQSFLGRAEKMVTAGFSTNVQRFKDSGELVDWPIGRIIRCFVGIAGSYIIPSVLLGRTDQLDVDASCREATEFLVRGLTPSKDDK